MTGLQRGHDQIFRQITFTARGWVDGACYWKAYIDAVPASLITRDAGTHLLGMTRAGFTNDVGIGDMCPVHMDDIGDPIAQNLLRFFQRANRSEEHTSELQSLMRISYAVFCLKKKHRNINITHHKMENDIRNKPDRLIT